MPLFAGLVGELQSETSDVGWANVFMVPERMQYIGYSHPYRIDYASFLLSNKAHGHTSQCRLQLCREAPGASTVDEDFHTFTALNLARKGLKTLLDI